MEFYDTLLTRKKNMFRLSRDYFYDKESNNIFYFCRNEDNVNQKKKNYVEDSLSSRRIYYYNAISLYLNYRIWLKKGSIDKYFSSSKYDQKWLSQIKKRFAVLKNFKNDIFRTENISSRIENRISK